MPPPGDFYSTPSFFRSSAYKVTFNQLLFFFSTSLFLEAPYDLQMGESSSCRQWGTFVGNLDMQKCFFLPLGYIAAIVPHIDYMLLDFKVLISPLIHHFWSNLSPWLGMSLFKFIVLTDILNLKDYCLFENFGEFSWFMSSFTSFLHYPLTCYSWKSNYLPIETPRLFLILIIFSILFSFPSLLFQWCCQVYIITLIHLFFISAFII